jgi:hypothetical protein
VFLLRAFGTDCRKTSMKVVTIRALADELVNPCTTEAAKRSACAELKALAFDDENFAALREAGRRSRRPHHCACRHKVTQRLGSFSGRRRVESVRSRVPYDHPVRR